jgi:sterol desaturase/sphingolipid hydroxylase (fatty acid hydroxylase superfamily)
MSFAEFAAFSLGGNVLTFVVSVLGCWAVQRAFRHRTIFTAPQPLARQDVVLSLVCMVLNAGVALVGWALWKQGTITLTEPSIARIALDTGAMLLWMDVGMYWTHRIAHHPLIFPLIHKLHHTQVSTNPLSLFVLHPVEVAGFGALMIGFLLWYPMAFWGLNVYLVLNVLFGTLGHTGVEPFPRVWTRSRVLRLIGTSTFHAEHHEQLGSNYGFYTLIWDHLFGTADPRYLDHFERAHLGRPVLAAP